MLIIDCLTYMIVHFGDVDFGGLLGQIMSPKPSSKIRNAKIPTIQPKAKLQLSITGAVGFTPNGQIHVTRMDVHERYEV